MRKNVLYVKQAMPMELSTLRAFLMQQPEKRMEAATMMFPTGFLLMTGWLSHSCVWPFLHIVTTCRLDPETVLSMKGQGAAQILHVSSSLSKQLSKMINFRSQTSDGGSSSLSLKIRRKVKDDVLVQKSDIICKKEKCSNLKKLSSDKAKVLSAVFSWGLNSGFDSSLSVCKGVDVIGC